jgi:hypothetical protein
MLLSLNVRGSQLCGVAPRPHKVYFKKQQNNVTVGVLCPKVEIVGFWLRTGRFELRIPAAVRSVFVPGATPPQWAMAPSFTRFLDHTQRRTIVSGTPLDG